jgi:hypothetical protein
MRGYGVQTVAFLLMLLEYTMKELEWVKECHCVQVFLRYMTFLAKKDRGGALLNMG